MNNEILKLENITKIYDNGILANHNVNLSVQTNEIHAIVGENGAGKSTLMKIIFGMEQPTTGTYYLRGEKCTIASVDQAIKSGIGMVHQHLMLVESMDVVDNVMLGIEPKRGLFINKSDARKQVEEIAKKYMFKLDFDQPVSKLSVGMKQKVEIVKALIRGAKILILDEPTAVLTPQETEELFVQLKALSDNGHTILFISHKLKEVKAISNRITVIRKGETQGTFATDSISLAEITKLMVGRNVELVYDKKPMELSEIKMSIKNVSTNIEGGINLKDITMDLSGGCIVGIAGVEGNGQNELVNILTRKRDDYTGIVSLNGHDIRNQSVKKLRNQGFGYIPEDRMHEGIAPLDTISDNVISTRYDQKEYLKGVQLRRNAIHNYADELIEKYQIACQGNDHVVAYLSGGNIQKVVVSRECGDDISMLVAEQPTRGVDLGAAEIIHKRLIEMRDAGVAILLISADLNEVVALSDVCLVMYSGEIVARLDNPKSYSEQELGEYMLGLKRQGGTN